MRYLTPGLIKDLQKKMVFVGGPRQVGKTHLSKVILQETYKTNGRYFNWDFDEHRREILQKKWHEKDQILIFDELHKLPGWKNWLKGVYDVLHEQHHFMVTGSARLNIYRRGGDSLMGRYHYWRLHPFSLDEIPIKINKVESFKRLMSVGGFPEVFLDADETAARRWRKERYEKIFREDVRDLEPIRDIQYLSLLLDLLRKRAGNLVVYSNLAEDLQVSFTAIKHWIEVLEKMYVIFNVRPYTKNLARAIQKPPKIYFFDNADIIDSEGFRFENLVATHLLKRLNYIEDSQGYRMELRYVRDKEGHEVDFIILKDGAIEELVEAKFADNEASKSLQYFAERLQPKRATQLVAHLKQPYSRGRLHVMSAAEYFAQAVW